jgi:sugar lactone lactonase YvrE
LQMIATMNRYSGPAASATEGWAVTRLTPPSRLHGANGLAIGPDGRLHVAQVPGSCISAIDVDTGVIEVISAMGGDIVGPDDLAFDEHGNMYATEITENRVSMRTPGGKVTILQGDMPVANPITYHQGRLIAGECRMGARIMELDRGGGAPRVILDNLPMVNAFQVGPDGKLYFPAQGANEIWRVNLDGSGQEVVAKDLGVPDSVKFDSKGRIVTTQVGSGQVLRLDIQAGTREVLADLGPGLDNVAFIGDRIFVSSIPGEITEILGGGKIREVVPRALQWPLGLGVGAGGELFVADGAFGYTIPPGGKMEFTSFFFSPGSPGYMRGIAQGSQAGEWLVTTGLGSIARFRPGEGTSDFIGHGFDQLMGIDANAGGAVVFAEYGTGRVHLAEGDIVREIANGLDKPMGVAVDGDTAYVAVSGAGKIVRLRQGGPVETVAEGLGCPQGLCLSGGKLYTVDTEAKALIQIDPASGAQSIIASNLPVGAPAGIRPKFLSNVGDMAGPMVPFADVTSGPDGTLYVSADAEGSVLAIREIG